MVLLLLVHFKIRYFDRIYHQILWFFRISILQELEASDLII
jgi:hypothetical protein